MHLQTAVGFLALLLALSIARGAAAVSFSIGTNFTGTDRAEEILVSFNPQTGSGSSSIPPDTMGAVGPNHIVELINGQFAVYDKTGNNLGRSGLNTFWNSALTNAGGATSTTTSVNPRILYDPFSSRWYAAAVDNPNSASSRVLVGVTTGADPGAANWRAFTIDPDTANTRWADFPTVGLDANGLYIVSSMFDAPGGAAEATTVGVVGVPKSSLTGVTPDVSGFQVRENINPNNIGFSFQPAVDMSNSSLPLAGLSRFNSVNLKHTEIPANFFSGGGVGSAAGLIASANAETTSDAEQPGASQNIDTNDSRISGNVVLQNGSLWAVHSFEDAGGRNGVHWFEIDPANDIVLQEGTITDPTLSLYYPSIAVNSRGDVVIGFNGSSESAFVGSYAVVGLTQFAVTTFSPISLLKAGEASYQLLDGGRNRWGEYSATVVDPTNPLIFWTFQEYARAPRDPDGSGPPGFGAIGNNWAVQVTQIIVPEPSSLALAGFAVVGLAGQYMQSRKRKRTRSAASRSN